jgi:hypothetical protein
LVLGVTRAARRQGGRGGKGGEDSLHDLALAGRLGSGSRCWSSGSGGGDGAVAGKIEAR